MTDTVERQVKVSTRFIPATDTLGSRITVRGEGHSCTVGYDHAAGDAHETAVAEFMRRYFGGYEFDIAAQIERPTGYRFEINAFL